MQASASMTGALPKRAERRTGGGFSTLYQKELADHFRSARFKLLFLLLTLTSLASLFGAFDGLMSAQTSEYIFLSMYTTSGSSIPSFASFLAYLAPLVGLALGFDAINRERSQGHAQPPRFPAHPPRRGDFRQVPGGGRQPFCCWCLPKACSSAAWG